MSVFFDRPGKVSIWLGLEGPTDNDRNVDVLRDLCGVEYYDLDFGELFAVDDSFPEAAVANLLGGLSYSASFLQAALKAATKKGIGRARWALAQYDFAYNPKEIPPSRRIAADPVFIGVFDWNDGEAKPGE